MTNHLHADWSKLPAPVDDGAADHPSRPMRARPPSSPGLPPSGLKPLEIAEKQLHIDADEASSKPSPAP
jgi:hypothetical protein